MSEQTAAPAGRRGRGWYWAWIPVGMFVVQGVILAITITLATGRGLNAVEPDYYRRSLAWDEQAALLRSADKLGWTVEASVGPQTGVLPDREVAVSVLGPDGHALAGASVQVEMFHHGSAGDRRSLNLEPGDGTGAYTTQTRIRRAGLWELRVLVERGSDRALVIQHVEVGG